MEWLPNHNESRPRLRSRCRERILRQLEAFIHLIQLLLPLYDNSGRAFPPAHFSSLRDELATRFGGLTAYTRAPAQGLWHESERDWERERPPTRDDIVVYEVMTDTLDRAWWAQLRRALEQRFAQHELVIRSQEVERL